MSNFQPVLFFYEWELKIATDICNPPKLQIDSGLVRIRHDEDLDPPEILGYIQDDLICKGWKENVIKDGRVLSIKRV
jgi:hypothetical protein